MSAATPYVLIAISNVARATTFREAAAESLHLDVAVVRDGEDAIQEMTRRGTPALLIVDLSLPRVDGFTIVRKLRRTPAEHPTHIVVVAAHESLRMAARELSSSLGIAGILPLDADKATVRSVIFAGLDPSQEPERPNVSAVDIAIAKGDAIEPEEIVDRAVLEIRRRFGMPIGVAYMKAGDRETLALQAMGTGSDIAAGVGDLLDVAVLRQVAEGTDPLIVPDADSHPIFAALASRTKTLVRGFAAVPAGSGHESLRAVLCVADTRPVVLSVTEVDALATFGRRIGAELERLVPPPPVVDRKMAAEMPEDLEALQHLAATDPLTGIANRRGGEKHISSEISRAKREKRPLSCILMDIDRFKAVNDTYGHQAGDQLLRDVSALLRKTIRAYDILVRWGGEEFLLVLPGAGLDIARSLADRLRVAVETMDTHGIGRVTISAGAAEFQNDYDFASTLRTADRRLYQAKASGRNCIV